ncbi:MAG: plasmid replication protein RepC [Thiotrichaceae bacterium]
MNTYDTIEARPGPGLRAISLIEQQMSLRIDDFEGLPIGTRKGSLLAAVKQAAPILGISEKSVYLLDQLMAYSMEQDWQKDRKPIVWPSNERLCDALGIGLRALQYRLKALRDSGLIVSKYGAQERRYGRRGPDKNIIEAYGFDLSPLALRYQEFKHAAAELYRLRQERQTLRRRRTIASKSLRMLAATAFEIGLDAIEWTEIAESCKEQVIKSQGIRELPRLRQLVDDLESTRADVEAHFKSQVQMLEKVTDQKKIASEGAKTCITDTTTTDFEIDKSNTVVKQQKTVHQTSSFSGQAPSPSSSRDRGDRVDPIEQTITKYQVSPKMVANLSPWFSDCLPKDRTLTWLDIADAGQQLHKLVGISQSVWQESLALIGREASAVLIAIIFAKRKEIRSKGGYFRGMVRAAKRGELNLGPTLYAIQDKAKAQEKSSH